jgi:hypothetical protein
VDEAGDQPDPSHPCPNCGNAVASSTTDEAILQCAHCGTQFFRPDDTVEPQPDDSDRDAAQSPAPADEELSGLRIRQIAALRRGAYRSRSYCIIGAATCLAAVINLALLIFHSIVDSRLALRPIGYLVLGSYVVLIAVALWGVNYFVRRVIDLTRELGKTLLEEPADPPDFSTLSDGTQHVKHLEEMGEAKDA